MNKQDVGKAISKMLFVTKSSNPEYKTEREKIERKFGQRWNRVGVTFGDEITVWSNGDYYMIVERLGDNSYVETIYYLPPLEQSKLEF